MKNRTKIIDVHVIKWKKGKNNNIGELFIPELTKDNEYKYTSPKRIPPQILSNTLDVSKKTTEYNTNF